MANKFDDLLEQFGSTTETLKETVIVDKKYLEKLKRKAKAFDRIKDIHSDYSIGDAKCIEQIADELERVDGER
ncbi:hypothetical protein ACWEWU_14570 [Staphylococcus xylosus]